jgi:D-alanyl-D-alanine-carboxypeptidase/D-alanyl-D-alanine-endopeptidase
MALPSRTKLENEMKRLAILVLCVAVQTAWAQELDPAVRAMALKRVSTGHVPALVIATIDGTRTQVVGFGRVSSTSSVAPDENTVFEIGSVSKTFTALLLADAVARGVVTLDEPVATLLPGYAVPSYQGKQITLLDLATQSSGLPRLPDNLKPRNIDDPYADYDEAALKAFLAGYTLPRAPGAKYEYSNLGMGLLGQALATQAHASYADLIAQRIAAPLGMHDTGVTMSARMQSLLAPGHDGAGKEVKNWNLAVLAGAGGVRSNAHDMLLYLQAHMRAMAPPAPLGLRTVWQDQRAAGTGPDRIGLAWHLRSARGQRIAWHNGMTGGYASFVGFSADGQHGVVVLANASVSVDDIGVRALVGADPVGPASERAPALAAPAALAPYLGRYQLAPGMIFTVSVDADGLLVQLTGQPAIPVFARKPDEFFYKVVDASLQFERAADGTVSAVTLHQNGQVMRSPRVPK